MRGEIGEHQIAQGAARLLGGAPLVRLPHDVLHADDRVVVIIRVEARGRESGAEVRARYANVWTFRDGKVVLKDSYWKIRTTD